MKILKIAWIPAVISIVLISSAVYALRDFRVFSGAISMLNSFSSTGIANDVDLETIRETITPLKDPVLHIGLAGEFLNIRDTENAIAEYRTALNLEPADVIAHAGIVHSLLEEWIQKKSDERQSRLQSALEEAIKTDPQNSFYNYIRAAVYCMQGAVKRENPDKNKKYEIVDKKLVEQGLAEVITGNTKQYYSAYESELTKAILKVMERTGRTTHPITQAFVFFSFPLHISVYAGISDTLAELSEVYEKEGSLELCPKPHEAVSSMGKRIAGSSKWLVTLLVGTSMQNKSENKLAEYYTRTGVESESIRIKEGISRREELQNELRKIPFDIDNRKFGLLDTLIIPFGGWDDYSPETGRRMEYAFLESVFAAVLSVKIIVLILICVFCWFYAGYCGKKYSLPQYRIIWKVKDLVFIYGFGLIAPLFFYLLYDRFHHLREFGFGNVAPLVLFQGEVIMFVILALMLLLTARRLREKLEADDVPTVTAGDKMKRYGAFAWLLFALPVAFFWIGIDDWNNGFYWLMLSITGAGAVIVTITGWILSVREITKKGGLPKMYNIRIAYCKSMVPILAGALVILLIVFFTIILPYYNRSVGKYESAVINRLIEDEVGMTRWKQLRDLNRQK
ncbi:MAG: hypothetical protein HZA48_02950 [Planctomycetes bacterium]|nr:hypothetical protein [Planctomycetota bacterium]